MEMYSEHKSSILNDSSNYNKVIIDLKEEFIQNNNRKNKIKKVNLILMNILVYEVYLFYKFILFYISLF